MKKDLVVALALVLVACKSKEKAPDPAPASASGPGSGSAVAPPAGSNADSAAAGSAAAGSAAAPVALTISATGVGPIEGKLISGSDDAIIKTIQTALKGYPELTVSLDVIDVGDGESRPQSHFSVKRGDTEVLSVTPPEGNVVEIHAVDAMFSTKDGVKPWDTAAVLGKLGDVACTARKEFHLGVLTCTRAAEPKIVYVLVASGYTGKASKQGEVVDLAAVADRKIVSIVTQAPGA